MTTNTFLQRAKVGVRNTKPTRQAISDARESKSGGRGRKKSAAHQRQRDPGRSSSRRSERVRRAPAIGAAFQAGRPLDEEIDKDT